MRTSKGDFPGASGWHHRAGIVEQHDFHSRQRPADRHHIIIQHLPVPDLEMAQVAVGLAPERRPEEGGETALAQQGELPARRRGLTGDVAQDRVPLTDADVRRHELYRQAWPV